MTGSRGGAPSGPLQPDVVLMDVRMPTMDGVEATREVVAAAPETKVVVLTTFDLDEYAFSALQAGASGFLLKRCTPEDLLDAIRVVHSGTPSLILDDASTHPNVTSFWGATPAAERSRHLDRARGEVWFAIARGLTNAEIAGEPEFVSEATVGDARRPHPGQDRYALTGSPCRARPRQCGAIAPGRTGRRRPHPVG